MTDLDTIAQELAEHIASQPPWTYEISYLDDKRPPAGVAAIKAELLLGAYWLSWLDDTVEAGLNRMREAAGV
jgi:hypothetical protein